MKVRLIASGGVSATLDDPGVDKGAILEKLNTAYEEKKCFTITRPTKVYWVNPQQLLMAEIEDDD